MTDPKRAVQLADKYVRKKDYRCLFPGCIKKAIRSHAISRASLLEALAQNGKLYGLSQSYNEVLRKSSPHDPMEIVKIGVNRANVFKGFCPEHDTKLFTPVELPNEQNNKWAVASLHLKALTLEYARRRRTIDYQKKFIEFDLPSALINAVSQGIKSDEIAATYIKYWIDVFLTEEFPMNSGPVDYFGIPFSKNLGVSCCGVFDQRNGLIPPRFICYNIISYKDISAIVLTAFGDRHMTLDSFIGSYGSFDEGYGESNRIERMVNDVAFLKGEEPLILTHLWESLSDEEKHEIGLCLVHPEYRSAELRPNFIKIGPDDFLTEVTPDVVTKLWGISLSVRNHLSAFRED